MGPHDVTTIDSLLEALDARGDSAEERRRFDEAVWAARGSEGSILVTDLSNFTRLTKKHGILHFLAVFRRCQVSCLPVIEKHGGTMMKQEADDLIVLFEEPRHALSAAVQMLHAANAVNAELPDPDDHVQMCMGIEHGRMLRLDDDAFGDPVNVAFKLGEDIAEPNEILVGPEAYRLLTGEGFDFGALELSGEKSVELGNVRLSHYSVRLAS